MRETKLDKLRHTLLELESELASVAALDDETRARLEALRQEISQILTKSSVNEHHGHESLISRLQDAAEEFESSHPTLFGIVSRTIDALGQMGI
jgi:hypothetical protein